MVWDKVVKEQVCALWKEGISATNVAARFKNADGKTMSRNTVLTIVRAAGPEAQRAPVKKREYNAAGMRKKKSSSKGFALPHVGQGAANGTKAEPSSTETTAVCEPLRLEDGSLVTLDTLHHNRMCKYPLGDPGTDGFHYCGNEPKPGSPYCPGHHARCYTPVTGVSKIDPKVIRNSGINRCMA